MKATWFKPLGAAVLAAGITFAQAPATAPPAHPFANRQQRFARLANYLNLTDSQKEQAQAVLKDAHQSALALLPQLKQNHEALAEAVKSGKSDSEIAQLAATQGDLLGRMIAIRTQAFAKIYQTLTPEQRAKADLLRDHIRGRLREWLQNRRQG